MRNLHLARNLTNLECVALAHLNRIGPCTAHELRQAFTLSTAGRYSGSAGAIYPLVKRLQAAGFIDSKSDANGAQNKQVYCVVAKGEQAVKQWLLTFEPKDIFPDDPLRTRFQYIRQLSKDEQRQWLDAANAALTKQNQNVIEEYQAMVYQNPVDKFVCLGVLETNKTRQRWIKSARKLLAQSDDS